jgi:hypothetical protein
VRGGLPRRASLRGAGPRIRPQGTRRYTDMNWLEELRSQETVMAVDTGACLLIVPVKRPWDCLIVADFAGNRSILRGAATTVATASSCDVLSGTESPQ